MELVSVSLTVDSNLQERGMHYSTKDEQIQLLQQVLAASETDADEERVAGELGSSGGFRRVGGAMSSLSGADDAVYHEYSQRSSFSNVKHPLFKKFRC